MSESVRSTVAFFVPEEGHEDGTGEGPGGPDVDDSLPAAASGRCVVAGDDVAGGSTHVAQEVDEAGGGGGGAAAGEVGGGGADEENLRAVNAEANDDQ